MREVNALLLQTQALRGHLDKAIALQPQVAAASSSIRPSPTAPATLPAPAPRGAASLENQVLHDNVPLSREEIAKLLMITAKAWKLRLLSDKQRSFIKMIICKQEGYLRVVLSFEGNQRIFQALQAVGGDDSDDSDDDDKDDDDDTENDDEDDDKDDDEDDWAVEAFDGQAQSWWEQDDE